MTVSEYNHTVHQCSDDLYRFALRYSNISAAAQDAVQDVFLTLWERRTEVETATAKGYLVRTLYRRLIDLHRHDEVVRRSAPDAPAEAYAQHEAFELRDAMAQALAQLPEQQRALVLLRDLEGYDYAAMAAMTGLSEQQVGVYLFRARMTLKKLLEDYR
ncbi:MAG: sigma-70 family RNA polymerase sigma factor [Bacteroidales bacterium]|nr:sigma-70 family RNA polymerase sigma factor [Bacteroidales bacterium]